MSSAADQGMKGLDQGSDSRKKRRRCSSCGSCTCGADGERHEQRLVTFELCHEQSSPGVGGEEQPSSAEGGASSGEKIVSARTYSTVQVPVQAVLELSPVLASMISPDWEGGKKDVGTTPISDGAEHPGSVAATDLSEALCMANHTGQEPGANAPAILKLYSKDPRAVELFLDLMNSVHVMRMEHTQQLERHFKKAAAAAAAASLHHHHSASADADRVPNRSGGIVMEMSWRTTLRACDVRKALNQADYFQSDIVALELAKMVDATCVCKIKGLTLTDDNSRPAVNVEAAKDVIEYMRAVELSDAMRHFRSLDNFMWSAQVGRIFRWAYAHCYLKKKDHMDLSIHALVSRMSSRKRLCGIFLLPPPQSIVVPI